MAARRKYGGREKGTPNKLTAAMRNRIEEGCDPIGFLMSVANGEKIEAAPVRDSDEVTFIRPTLDQRMAAAQSLARKLVPDAKDSPIRIDLPEIEGVKDAVKAMAAITRAVGEGTITPSEGVAMTSIIETYRKVFETIEIEARLAALEGA